MSFAYITSIVISLGLTLLIECSLAWLIKIRGEAMKVVILMNCVTNPTVVTIWFFVRNLTAWNLIPLIVILESSVVLVEAKGLKGYVNKPFLTALMLNAVSYGLGTLL